MLGTRIRADGVREGICEDQLYRLPHDGEIVPNPLFAEAARDEFFLDPRFYYLSVRDLVFASAKTQIAAARDLEAMAFYFKGVSDLLMQCACMLRAEARRIVGPIEVMGIDREFEEVSPGLKSRPTIIELGSIDGGHGEPDQEGVVITETERAAMAGRLRSYFERKELERNLIEVPGVTS